MKSLSSVDLTKIVELQDDTDLSGELACAGGACEIDVDLSQMSETTEVESVNTDGDD
jgi:hypothetical protein